MPTLALKLKERLFSVTVNHANSQTVTWKQTLKEGAQDMGPQDYVWHRN